MDDPTDDPKSKDKPAESHEFPPERPLECTECKKPIAVQYTCIVGKNTTHTLMCADCPFLQQHLKGIPAHSASSHAGGAEAGLCCGNCGTTLESIRMGNTVGCSACYEIFEDVLVSELEASNKLPAHINPNNKKSHTLHIGRSLGETTEINPSLQLLALNDALSETLKLEDYEQAASIRDQIREITQKEAHQTREKKSSQGRNSQKDQKHKGNDEG